MNVPEVSNSPLFPARQLYMSSNNNNNNMVNWPRGKTGYLFICVE